MFFLLRRLSYKRFYSFHNSTMYRLNVWISWIERTVKNDKFFFKKKSQHFFVLKFDKRVHRTPHVTIKE